MQVNIPRGIFTSKFCKLWMVAFRISRLFEEVSRGGSGNWADSVEILVNHCPVGDFLALKISFTEPLKIISPPAIPGWGPISMTRSAALITCSSCSTTQTIFPAEAKSLRILTKRPMS